MTYAELQADIADRSHRKDMAARIPKFIESARVRINYRLTLELVPFTAPDDTNDILTGNPLLYFYPAMQGLFEFIEEFESASYYNQMFDNQIAAYYVTRSGTEPLTVTPEVSPP